MEFYVYVWRDSAGLPFYVGKGRGKRAYETCGRSAEFIEIYANGNCSVEIVDWFIHESQAHALEVELIAKHGRRDYGGGTLVNKTDGGEGVSGRIIGEGTRQRMSAAKIGISRGKMPDWHKAKIGASNKGKVRTDEFRRFLSEVQIGRKRPDDAVKRAASKNRGQKRSPESLIRMSAAQRGKKMPIGFSDVVKNRARRAPPSPSNTTGFKGVYLCKQTSKWRAAITVDGKWFSIGRFNTPEDAAVAYDNAAYLAWGDDCYLNFVEKYNRLDDSVAGMQLVASKL